ncbi:hypothetical protein CISG_07624 [Coccidioides immitis RMSCC 3703]|uniref:Uncharacterized protein n=1 Tax=Coccidioides immitis RMSCC 3703 TaxID=454286 RepID=A0A0J8R2J6_COCIT|nr:hypothetical protein CISG_07624 [Coccidioides immitis RMSCC 3703]
MASTCSSVRAFVILLISVIILLELVTGQPVDPYFSGPGAATENRGSPASPLPSTTGRCDTSYFALFSFPGNRASFNKREDAAADVHRIYARALESEHQGLSSREKLIIGLAAGIGGLCGELEFYVTRNCVADIFLSSSSEYPGHRPVSKKAVPGHPIEIHAQRYPKESQKSTARKYLQTTS